MSVAKVFGFADCPALREVRFPPGSALHILKAFEGSSLRLIRIPSSVTQLLLPRIALVEYLDNHRMKQSRRLIHLIQVAPSRPAPWSERSGEMWSEQWMGDPFGDAYDYGDDESED
jgi:hypothetical protein